jgi:zeaxanthin glucosyltransferase
MRIAFSTLPAAGHLNPTLALARKVRQRGHDVFFLGLPDCEPEVRAAGFEFRIFAERQIPVGSRKELESQLSRLHGVAGLNYTLNKLTELFEAVVIEAVPALREARADALVVDEALGGFVLVAAQLDLPVIHIANALPWYRCNSVPPPLSGWPYRTDALGMLRNRIGYAAVHFFMRRFRVRVREHRRRLGMPFDPADFDAAFSKLARIAQMPAAFDFPNPSLPPWFHYTGPFHDGLGRPRTEFPWHRLTSEPLIYASMGTIQNGAEQVFRTIAAACAIPGCQLVLSLGENVSPESVGPLPGNCVAVARAPQLELLQRAALCITHAGMNTALESLAAGVPMVAIPVTNDQPAVAARIAHTQTGVVVPFRRINPAELQRAVRQVLGDDRYRDRARQLQTTIQAVNGLERAADIIERSFGAATQPPRSP